MEDLWLKVINNLDINDSEKGICHALYESLKCASIFISSNYYHKILELYFKENSLPYWAGDKIDNDGRYTHYMLSDEETYWRRVNICLFMHEMYIKGEI